MHVSTNCTPALFMRATSAVISPANGMVSLKYAVFTLSFVYFFSASRDPSAQIFDSDDTPYPRMPTFVKLFCTASHDVSGPRQLKQIAGTVAKMLVCGCCGVLAISGLMFQMNVGWFALASVSAPVNCSVASIVANA